MHQLSLAIVWGPHIAPVGQIFIFFQLPVFVAKLRCFLDDPLVVGASVPFLVGSNPDHRCTLR